MANITVNLCAPDLGIADEWDALSRRAAANVFMNPAALAAANASGLGKIHVLLAWAHGEGPDSLVGLWALRECRMAPLCPKVLAAPPYEYAFVSNPVVDPAVMDDVIAAFFETIERNPVLPSVVRLRYLDGDAETYAAIVRVLAARGRQSLTLTHRERPFASKACGRKHTGSTRKKLRQDWNRLAARGDVDVINARAPADVRDAFEIYLAMEARSWKGAKGTALLSDEQDAAFARALIGALTARQDASVALLRVDGCAVAAQVLLYCATTAYTWKTAFDSRYAKYSPGALLVDKIADDLFANGSIEAIESCSPEGGFMAQLWDGHRTTIDLLVDVGAKESLNFIMTALGARGYSRLRGLRNRIRAASRAASPRRRRAAATR